jgi:hypothetical protein
MATTLAVTAIFIATASMVFAGLQTRILARQTALLASTSQLSNNTQLLIRLDEVLLMIADDPPSHAHVWGQNNTVNLRPEIAAECLIDVLDAAKDTTARNPGFSAHDAAWDAYIEFVFNNSQNTLDKVLAHPDWWPQIAPSAMRVVNAQQNKAATAEENKPRAD